MRLTSDLRNCIQVSNIADFILGLGDSELPYRSSVRITKDDRFWFHIADSLSTALTLEVIAYSELRFISEIIHAVAHICTIIHAVSSFEVTKLVRMSKMSCAVIGKILSVDVIGH